MVEGKAKLVIDLGNSETRVMTIFGKTKSGKPKRRLTTISNKFGELFDDKLLNVPDYTAENSKVFVVDGGTICAGLMCDKEKGTASMRPSASFKKYESTITTYSLRLAFLQGFMDVADITKQEVSSVDVAWDVFILLPPSDLELGKEKLQETIKGINEIDFLMPVFKKPIKVDNVRVFPEGFCAFIGEVFESGKQIRQGFKDVLKSSALVIDIGAGTTDLCIIDDVKLVQESRHSEETGGNQVFQKINTELRRKLGKNFPEDSLRKAAVSGTIKVGAREIDVRQEVAVAKKDIAAKLSVAIRNYIESSNFDVLDIENILICGGGADDCEVTDGMRPLGDYLKENLEVWMNYSNFLEIPYEDKIVEVNGDEVVKKEPISPRLLNIYGAGVLSENY